MIGFEGRHQWRQHKLFKLRAKLLQCENQLDHNKLVAERNLLHDGLPHLKFAIRLFLVRRTKNKQTSRRAGNSNAIASAAGQPFHVQTRVFRSFSALWSELSDGTSIASFLSGQ
jgi:hypothetical protein